MLSHCSVLVHKNTYIKPTCTVDMIISNCLIVGLLCYLLLFTVLALIYDIDVSLERTLQADVSLVRLPKDAHLLYSDKI